MMAFVSKVFPFVPGAARAEIRRWSWLAQQISPAFLAFDTDDDGNAYTLDPMLSRAEPGRQTGMTLIEVLVAMLILSIGLLGAAVISSMRSSTPTTQG
jgi:prepilin-type N-terminal cleavage/methylation domain-containing protein